MKWLLTVAFLASSLSLQACGKKDNDSDPELPAIDDPELRLTHESPSPLRGYKSINNLVRARLIDDPDFQLLQYLQGGDGEKVAKGGSILPLFGGYIGRGTAMSNSSAVPRPMNMLLWFVAFDGLARPSPKRF